MTLTWSKVKIKVTVLLKLRKLHSSRSISSAILAWSSKLMVDHDSTGPSLQLVGARFSNFLLRKHVSTNFAECQYDTNFKRLLLEATFTWWGTLAVLCVLRILMWPWPDSRSRTFWSSENCTFLRLPPPRFWRGSHNSCDYDSTGPSVQLVGARFLNSPTPVGGHVTSKFAKCWYHQNPLRVISGLAEARSLWLQVGRNKPCTLAAMTVSPLAGLFIH